MGTFGSQTSSYNRLVTAFVAVGSLTYGYCSSIISSTIGQPGWYTYFNLPQEGQPGYASTTTSAISTANGVYSAGGAVGCLFIMCMFQAGRFICGLGIGILVTVCPLYLSEISSAFRRGWLVGHHAIFLVFGYMLAGWVGYACYFAQGQMGTFSWRFPLCLQCLPPFFLLLGSPWVPRSPRWLISKGKQSEAQSVLERLRKSPDDPDNLVAKEKFYQTAQQIHLEKERLFVYGSNNYAVILYTNLGMTGGMPLLLRIIYNPLGAWLHDRVNSRRKMYIVGFFGIIISTSCLAGMTPQTFCDTTMYLYVSEIFPTEIRPIGMGFSLFGQFAVIYFFFPETARLTLEEVAKNFGEEVAVRLTDATDEEKARLERDLAVGCHAYQSSRIKTESETVDDSVFKMKSNQHDVS
ncbi:MFS general substrate transporter [Aspergillus uvarum CBS 121591]|uniref:MFS general substrate transporter n=1 Tax=Aspergillus uvarum CBS 121591 TaxID=1448315 RepID=A0A319C3B2_9EURO|nr:MFS general substrate transporter [Aspergillus uvarum CBS 121591]PYH78319.1 MFS general substrate transporter [Aspergillus uvarum CBS 121591]